MIRRILVITASILYAAVCFAQKDVTKFLGFPVDGSKSEMIKNLKSKGFKLSQLHGTDVLNGRFNGNDVNIYISTENGKVSRLMVCDENYVSETDIKIRFNRLCSQFNKNGKYLSLHDYMIPNDEDISYEMAVNKKRYEALFYQLPDGETIDQLHDRLLKEFQNKYTPEQLESPTDEIRNEVLASAFELMMNSLKNKPVWFMITEYYGKFYITMFYENEYNCANGEDL